MNGRIARRVAPPIPAQDNYSSKEHWISTIGILDAHVPVSVVSSHRLFQQKDNSKNLNLRLAS